MSSFKTNITGPTAFISLTGDADECSKRADKLNADRKLEDKVLKEKAQGVFFDHEIHFRKAKKKWRIKVQTALKTSVMSVEQDAEPQPRVYQLASELRILRSG